MLFSRALGGLWNYSLRNTDYGIRVTSFIFFNFFFSMRGHKMFYYYTSTTIIFHDFILFEVALFPLRKK
jgi:hypothetical protein